jgi:hypothetical protein
MQRLSSGRRRFGANQHERDDACLSAAIDPVVDRAALD